jgi:hypothetical protein
MIAKDFYGYTIYEDGRIFNEKGKEIKKRIHNGKYEVRLIVNGTRRNFIFARLYYYLFIDSFEMDNKDLCISPKDGNHLNVDKNNLILIHRKDLIQGDKHKAIAKLTDKQIDEIKLLYTGWVGYNQHNKQGYSYNDLAKIYAVTKGEIAQIIQGRTRNQDKYKLK